MKRECAMSSLATSSSHFLQYFRRMMPAVLLAAVAGLLPSLPAQHANANANANATLCAVESCMTMPTNCAARDECQGCGMICMPNAHDERYSMYLNATGLSEQVNVDTAFSTQQQQQQQQEPACPWPTTKKCIRGEGNLTIQKWKSNQPASASEAGCCTACAQTTGCVAWQLIAKGGDDAVECWAMGTTAIKNASPDTCTSGSAEPPPPKPPAPHGFAAEIQSADVVIHWVNVQPLPPPAPLQWAPLLAACRRARAAGNNKKLIVRNDAAMSPPS